MTTSYREIWLVRHAQSQANAKQTWQGQGDSQLSKLGEQQVDRLRDRLRGAAFDVAVSSDLRRAVHTATAVDSSLNTVERDSAWREIDVGAWEGLTMQEVMKRFPHELVAIKNRQPVRIGGAESWDDLATRVDSAFEQLLTRIKLGQRALVVAHGAVIGTLLSGLANQRHVFPSTFGHMHNTGITIVRIPSQGAAELAAHNDDRHVNELRAIDPWSPENADGVLTLRECKNGVPANELVPAVEHALLSKVGHQHPISGLPLVRASHDAFHRWVIDTLAGQGRPENTTGSASATEPPRLTLGQAAHARDAVAVVASERRTLISLTPSSDGAAVAA